MSNKTALSIYEKLVSLANDTIDDRIDLFGCKETVLYLLDYGFTREELIDMDFDEEEVDKIIKEKETILCLLDCGLTREELIAMDFSTEDVDRGIEDREFMIKE